MASKVYHSAYRARNRERMNRSQREYYGRNREAINQRKRNTRANNRKRHQLENRESRRRYDSIQLKNNLQFRLKEFIRKRIRAALAGKNKSANTLSLLGMQISEYRSYLHGQFRDGMTWENYGSVWHIDHIRPCVKFDLSDPEQQRECFNWSNTQPLLVGENLKKGSR